VNTAIARLTDVPAGILAGCDRLVHPTVTDGRERDRQRRFIGVLLAAPLAAGAVLALMPAAGITIGARLALLCSVIAIFWTLALSVSLTGKSVSAERVALGLAVLGVSAAGVAGGASSPLILFAAAIGFETWWIGRSRSAALLGVTAAAASLGAYLMMGTWFAILETGPARLWQWLPPMLYAILSWQRARDLLAHAYTDQARTEPASLETPFDLPMLQLSSSGEIVGASQAAARAFGLPLDVLVGSALRAPGRKPRRAGWS
jgi:cell cycle sensor histidine kinase DivJ